MTPEHAFKHHCFRTKRSRMPHTDGMESVFLLAKLGSEMGVSPILFSVLLSQHVAAVNLSKPRALFTS